MNYCENELYNFGNHFSVKPRFDFIDLHQICEVVLGPCGKVYEHKQVCHEITYVISGKGILYTNNKAYSVSAGDIQLISIGDLHKLEADADDKLQYICVAFTFHEITEEFREICSFFMKSPDRVENCTNDLRTLFDILMNEYYVIQDERKIAITDLLKLILVNIYRLFTLGTVNHKIAEGNNKHQDIVYSTIRYIDRNIETIHTVAEIARYFHYSESYLSTVFKKKIGMTLQSYICEKKLERAKILLSCGKLSVAEVSSLLNFEYKESFCRSFKRAYGITPTQFILKNHNSQNKNHES